MDWYEENIEEGIRPIVKLLRDNGINTTYSCHHAMVVEAEYYGNGDAEKVKEILDRAGYPKYKIQVTLYKDNRTFSKELIIKFPMSNGEFCP